MEKEMTKIYGSPSNLDLSKCFTTGNKDQSLVSLKNINDLASNSVQTNGNSSGTYVIASNSNNSRLLSDRAGDELFINDFDEKTDALKFISATNAVSANSHVGILKITPGTILTGDDSDALAAANKSIVYGQNAKFENFRRKQVNSEQLPSPFMFGPTVRPEHLKRFHLAVASGTVNVVIVGDSIWNIGGSIISVADLISTDFVDELKKQNPGATINIYNYTIGGKNWGDMWSDSSQPPAWFDNDKKLNWKEFVAAANPDLIVAHSGGNDGYGFDCVAFHNWINYYNDTSQSGMSHVPSIIFGITYQPSLGSSVLDYNQTVNQNGIDFCSTYIRNYSIANNYGYLDFARWHAMCRDGIDIREVFMERVQPNSNLPEYATSFDTGNYYNFPDATTSIGVNANSCTSWLIDFQIDAGITSMEVQLSRASANSLTPTKNPLFIINVNGKIKVTYCDGVIRDVVSVQTDIPWPDGKSCWMIMCKDNRVRVEVQQPLDNGWDISNLGAHRMGMGYVSVFDYNVARFGAPYCPSISFSNNTSMTIFNLCVADNTQIYGSDHRDSCQRYKPIISDYEIYEENDDTMGGSGSYHMNGYGRRIIMRPLFRAQNWARPVFGYIDVAGLNSTDNISTSGVIETSSLGFFNNTWIGASGNQNAEGAYFNYMNNGAVSIVGNGVSKSGSFSISLSNGSGGVNKVFSTDSYGNTAISGLLGISNQVWIGASNFTASGLYLNSWNNLDGNATIMINPGKDSNGKQQEPGYVFKALNADGSNYPMGWNGWTNTGEIFRINTECAYGQMGIGMFGVVPPTTRPSLDKAAEDGTETFTSLAIKYNNLLSTLASYGIINNP